MTQHPDAFAAPTISVVIPARNAAGTVGAAVGAVVGQPAVAEVVVVDDASTDDTAAEASAAGARVLRLPARCGAAGARNAGVLQTTAEIVAFLDADDTATDRWAEEIAAAFASGAGLVAGGIAHAPAMTTAERIAPRAYPAHDLEARNGFLTRASTANLAMRRTIFDALAGFDELLLSGHDSDLSFRAGLAGYRFTAAPGAVVVKRARPTFWGLVRQRASRYYWGRIQLWKYRNFSVIAARRRASLRPIWFGAMRGVGHLVLGAGPTPRLAAAGAAFADAGLTAVERLASAKANADLVLLRRRPPPPVVPATADAVSTAAPLTRAPTTLIVGDARALTVLARALPVDPGLNVAPVSATPLAIEAVARWDEPAPWSRRLARRAAACGWRLPAEAVSKRLEQEAPESWGEAYLLLHAVAAWVRRKPAHVLAVAAPAGAALAELLPDVPLVAIGSTQSLPRRPDVVCPAGELWTHPEAAVDRLAPRLGIADPSGVAGALRLSSRWTRR